jgi:hypothetical protein
MSNCKLVSTPLTPSDKLLMNEGVPLGPEDCTRYRSMVRALQYLTLTQSDISFVNKACQFLHSPTSIHLGVVKRTIRYVKGKLKLGLHFVKSSSTTVSTFANAD